MCFRAAREMTDRLFVLLLGAAAAWAGAAHAAERPNILWITSEDNAAHWLGCYGNAEAKTPRLDALAAESLQFTRAYSNAPVCAVARCTILHGVYATSLGTLHMRSRHPIPEAIRPYVSYLREAGYYCSNNSKTDYNRRGSDRAIWDACGPRAHYRRRQDGQPFFAVFNLTTTHESSLFAATVAENRRRGVIPPRPRLDPAAVDVPPYLPDLPEVRQDLAVYHDNVTAMDTQVGKLLDELAAAGLADDTIVFYCSDHGGATPRGKRYLHDTGVRVPLMVCVPERWRRLTPFAAGAKVDELVSFVDLAPTVLSLAGVKPPRYMQGRALLGEYRVAPPESPAVLLFADRFDELEGMERGLTDGRYKYIRRFMPQLPAAPKSYYSLGALSWKAWRRAWQAGELAPEFGRIWEAPQPVEELYDLEQDPWEIRNLAGDAEQAARLVEFRGRLREELTAVRDAGLVPEAMFEELVGDGTIYECLRRPACDYARLLSAAQVATAGKAKGLREIRQALADADPVVRYWGAVGSVILGTAAHDAAEELGKLLDDPSSCVRVTAATALVRIGESEAGRGALIAEFGRETSGAATVHLLNAVRYLELEADVPQAWLTEHAGRQRGDEYVRRFADRLAAERDSAKSTEERRVGAP